MGKEDKKKDKKEKKETKETKEKKEKTKDVEQNNLKLKQTPKDKLKGKGSSSSNSTPTSSLARQKKGKQFGSPPQLDCAFKEVSVKLYIHLSPSYIGNIPRGIDQNLNQLLMKYDERLGGVVLSYSEVEILQRCGRILYDNPFIHFYIGTKFLVFAPSISSHLVGSVNKVSQGHIGLLVYGIFNTSITIENASKYYFTHTNGNAWVHSDTEETIEVGSEVLFSVKELETVNEILTIYGSLEGETTGLAKNLLPSILPSSPLPLPSRSKSQISDEEEDEDQSEKNEEEEIQTPPIVSLGKKSSTENEKKKKRKIEETEPQSEPKVKKQKVQKDDDLVSSPKKEKKDKKDKKDKKKSEKENGEKKKKRKKE